MTGQEQRQQNWSIERADHGAGLSRTRAESAIGALPNGPGLPLRLLRVTENSAGPVLRLVGDDRLVDMPGRGVWLGPYLQVVLGGGMEGVEAGPGEPADESFVDVGEPGVGEVVAQVIKVGPGLVRADGLAGCLGVGQGLVPGGDPVPLQN
jgi:hypothetical protein